MARKLANAIHVKRVYTVAIALACHLTAAHSDGIPLNDIFTLRGYGTLATVHSNQDQADFVENAYLQPTKEGAGVSQSWSERVDSRLALQLDAHFTNKFSGVLQIISEGMNNNSATGHVNPPFRPSIEWANLKYQVTDSLSVRGGRIVLPITMGAEYRKIGYANTTLRPSVDLYGHIPFSSSDGMDTSYRSNIDGATNTVQAFFGVQRVTTSFDFQATTFGLNDTVEAGPLTVRAGYVHLTSVSPAFSSYQPLVGPFVGALNSLPPNIANAALTATDRLDNLYDPHSKQTVHYYDLGAIYDPGQWIASAEVLRVQTVGIAGIQTSGYALFGYRIQRFTPYAAYGRVKSQPHHESPVPLTGLPPALAGLGSVVNRVFLSSANADYSQETLTAGLRWELVHNVALKGQYDRVRLDAGSRGFFANIQSGFQPGSHADVLGIGLDFVF